MIKTIFIALVILVPIGFFIRFLNILEELDDFDSGFD